MKLNLLAKPIFLSAAITVGLLTLPTARGLAPLGGGNSVGTMPVMGNGPVAPAPLRVDQNFFLAGPQEAVLNAVLDFRDQGANFYLGRNPALQGQWILEIRGDFEIVIDSAYLQSGVVQVGILSSHLDCMLASFHYPGGAVPPVTVAPNSVLDLGIHQALMNSNPPVNFDTFSMIPNLSRALHQVTYGSNQLTISQRML